MCVGIYYIYIHHVYNICDCILTCRVYVCVHVCDVRLHICTPRVHVCMYVYIHACRVCRCVCACLHVHTLLHMCMYVFTYTNAEFACVCVHSYTWMGTCVSYGCVLVVHWYVYIYVHICTTGSHVCVYGYIFAQQVCMCVYVSAYMQAEFAFV